MQAQKTWRKKMGRPTNRHRLFFPVSVFQSFKDNAPSLLPVKNYIFLPENIFLKTSCLKQLSVNKSEINTVIFNR